MEGTSSSRCLPSAAGAGFVRSHGRPLGNASCSIFPFVDPLSGVCWNCRSLCSRSDSSKLRFVFKLLKTHDFVVLTETRQPFERDLFAKGLLPEGANMFPSYVNHHQAGVCVLMNKTLIERFDCHPKWEVLSTGRICTLTLTGRRGALRIIPSYLDPSDAKHRAASIKRIGAAVEQNMHTLILGDFNLAMEDSNRITKSSACCHLSVADRLNRATWNEEMTGNTSEDLSNDDTHARAALVGQEYTGFTQTCTVRTS